MCIAYGRRVKRETPDTTRQHPTCLQGYAVSLKSGLPHENDQLNIFQFNV